MRVYDIIISNNGILIFFIRLLDNCKSLIYHIMQLFIFLLNHYL